MTDPGLMQLKRDGFGISWLEVGLKLSKAG
jgi:hypothetical protein